MSRMWLWGLRIGPALLTRLPPRAPSALRRLWPNLRVVVMVGFVALVVVGKLALSARLLSAAQVFHIGFVAVAVFVLLVVVDHVLVGLGLVDEEPPSKPTSRLQAVSVRQPPPITAAAAPAAVAASPGAPTGGTIPVSTPGQSAGSWRLEGGYVWRQNDSEGV